MTLFLLLGASQSCSGNEAVVGMEEEPLACKAFAQGTSLPTSFFSVPWRASSVCQDESCESQLKLTGLEVGSPPEQARTETVGQLPSSQEPQFPFLARLSADDRGR